MSELPVSLVKMGFRGTAVPPVLFRLVTRWEVRSWTVVIGNDPGPRTASPSSQEL